VFLGIELANKISKFAFKTSEKLENVTIMPTAFTALHINSSVHSSANQIAAFGLVY